MIIQYTKHHRSAAAGIAYYENYFIGKRQFY